MNTKKTGRQIYTAQKSACQACGNAGKILYKNLTDRLFGVPGNWTLKKCIDPKCGLAWLDPVPCEKELIKLYRSYYTHSGNDTKEKDGKKSWLQKIWKLYLLTTPNYWMHKPLDLLYLNNEKAGRMLEIGCGNGERLVKFRELGWQVEGQELDPVAANIAKKKYSLKIHVGEIEQLGLQQETFDAVIMNHVIEHVYNPDQLLTACCKLLKPGGIFVSVTPNIESLGHRIFKNHWRGLEPPRHLHIFSTNALLKNAKKSGFQKYRVSTTSANALIISAASFDLFKKGHHDMNANTPLGSLIVAVLFQYISFIICSISKNSGEECVLMAWK